MRIILKILTLIITIYILTNSAFALVKKYDFSLPWDYTISNSSTMEIADWWVRLIPQLEHTWSISNSDPWTLLNNVQDFIAEGRYIYAVWAISDWLTIIDVIDPSNPVSVSSLWKSWIIKLDNPRAITKSWNYVFIASNRDDAIEIINVSNPLLPTHADSIIDAWTTYLNWTRWLTISGSVLFATAYADDAIEIIDISNPNSVFHLWSLRAAWWRLNWAEWIAISWNYAYVTSFLDDSVQVIDISNPALPAFAWEITNSWATLLDWPKDIVIKWNYAYVASYESDALEVIDISDPNNPVHHNSLSTWWWIDLNGIVDLEISANQLLIATDLWDSHIFVNIEDPSELKIDSYVKVDVLPEITRWTAISKVWSNVYVSSSNEDRIIIIDYLFDSNGPNVVPNEWFIYSWSIDQISPISPTPGNLKYQISKDDWATWYYLSWTTWTTTTLWLIESSWHIQMNAEIQSFNNLAWWTGEFLWKAFLYSPWNIITKMDQLNIYYSSVSANEIIDFETAGWYTVTEWTFTRTTSNPQEWTYSIESWNNTNNSTSCFEVSRDIYTDSVLEFQKTVSSESWYDFLRFYINWTLNSEWSWAVAWSKEAVTLINWSYTFRWCYEKDYSVNSWSDKAWVDYIEIKEKLIVEENTVLDFEIPGWYTVTTSVTWEDWTRVTSEKSEWLYSIESQNNGVNNSNWCFERTQAVWVWETWISFYKKVSSEIWYDYLIFSIDWVEQNRWAWEIVWSKEEYSLSVWTYTLEWCYSKDGSVDTWSDRAWVDDLSIMQDIPVISEITQVPTPTNDTTPDYSFYSPITWTISYSGSCLSTTTGAIIWTNTVTFNTLSDWTYTDCSVQVLSSPNNSNILSVNNFTIDTTGINITINNPLDTSTIANTSFNIDVSYDDATSWVNTWSIVLNLYKWDWISAYWSDIAATYVNFTWATIWWTWAIYPTSILWAWQYKVKFSIEDNTWNEWINTIVFYVASWDATPPIVTFNHPFSWALLPNADFVMDISYNDPETWVNTWSIDLILKKWDWISSYWPDISSTYINNSWSVLASTWATYPISKLGFWRYEVTYDISNNSSLSSTWSFDFYVDEPEMIINRPSVDIWNLEAWVKKFWIQNFVVTIKTVWVWFDVLLKKDSALSEWTAEIVDWDWTTWFWFEQTPYVDTISVINPITIIASQSWSININWNKNTYQYQLQIWWLIDSEQVAGDYEWNISFWLDLDY